MATIKSLGKTTNAKALAMEPKGTRTKTAPGNKVMKPGTMKMGGSKKAC